MKTKKHDAIVLSSADEKQAQELFTSMLKDTPLPDDELLPNLGLYMSSKSFARLLFFYEIYQKIVNTHGVIMEFGVRWGQTLSILSALRGIMEEDPRIGYFIQSRISQIYFKRYIEIMKKLQAIIMNIPVEPI